jgi:tRNA(fMet)-specific endonuclease VapC
VKLVLDTNVVIGALNGVAAIRTALNSLDPADEVLLSAIVLAELRYGALCSAKREENLARVEEISSLFGFAGITRDVAIRFAEIKAGFRTRGIVKSDADLLIAATALSNDAVLVTADKALLGGDIPRLTAIDWSNAGESL